MNRIGNNTIRDRLSFNVSDNQTDAATNDGNTPLGSQEQLNNRNETIETGHRRARIDRGRTIGARSVNSRSGRGRSQRQINPVKTITMSQQRWDKVNKDLRTCRESILTFKRENNSLKQKIRECQD